SSPCPPRTGAAGVPVKPGPAVRMGITPAGEAGALGPKVPVVPIDQERTYAALAQLRPPGAAPFVLRLNRLFWSDGEAGVRRFAPNPRVIGLQVTNEVNFTVSPDSSDGAYKNARQALVRGVIAADDEAAARGFGQLTIGFNWFYRTDPRSEDTFWRGLWSDG